MNAHYFQARRNALVELIKQTHVHARGVVILCAQYEQPRSRFWQDSTFYYFSGLAHEPGAVLVIELDGASTLYIPTFENSKSQWVMETAICTTESAYLHGFVDIRPLGHPLAGYSARQDFNEKTHIHILEYINQHIAQGGSLFMPRSPSNSNFINNYSFERWCRLKPHYKEAVTDISPFIAHMRRKKDTVELAHIQTAVDITIQAYQAAQRVIHTGVSEAHVEAALAQTIYAAGARYAFPPIVASGARTTILHYEHNNAIMHAGDLLIIDSGAAWEGYAADISRTYAVSGSLNERQQYLYNKVLETQEYVFEHIKPGMRLSYKEQSQLSLHHIACEYLYRYDLHHYFVHGIGHFLGLDVHDVGNTSEPLQEGDVITIEPGLYLRNEGIGIRIEDNVAITSTGARILSDALPKNPIVL